MLVTGASGYVGGRLVPRLLEARFAVRTLSRDPDRLVDHPWAPAVERMQGDVLDAGSLPSALDGVDVAFYLIHTLGEGRSFEDMDRRAAQTFATAARNAGIRRIIYLSGLSPQAEQLSPHLRSRAEVGQILLSSGVPTVVLRAAVILGSGSASFEMLRHLTERLPVMVTPRWVRTRIQPIAIRDVLHYLVGATTIPNTVNRAFDIGGPDVLTYVDMMRRYAALAGLRPRVVIPVPVLSPGLSSHWVNVVTPVPRNIARPLVESLRNTVVCTEHDIARYVPDPAGGLLGFDQAVVAALQQISDGAVTTRWSDASTVRGPGSLLPTDPNWAGEPARVDERQAEVQASVKDLWRIVEGIGGENGWYSWPIAWAARGWLDRLFGGPGLRRGRRDPHHLRVGDALDWWRVEAIEPHRLLRLRAEMRLPGTAWLDLVVEPGSHGQARYRQRAVFYPKGLLGLAYWWLIKPFHGVVFGGMQRNIARAAVRLAK